MHGSSGSLRSMSLGIVVVALGLMSIISIAGGSPEVGISIGGAITIVGAAFIINSLVAATRRCRARNLLRPTTSNSRMAPVVGWPQTPC